MGLLQPHGRRGGAVRRAGLSGAERYIVVHSLGDARAALAAAASLGVGVTLASAPGAGISAGPGWFKAVVEMARGEFPAAACSCVLDCGDAAGTVLAALRQGLRRVVFTGPAATAARLADIAAQCGAVLERGPLEPMIDLLDQRDPAALCRDFLAPRHAPLPPGRASGIPPR
jgi:acyl-CoA reductase-like NAD-dependent aldehyde dehydrogenase